MIEKQILIKETIFILGIAKFDGPFESTSFTVAKFLAKHNKVFYIDYPYTWKDYLLKRDKAFKTRKKCFSTKSNGIIDTDIPNLKIIIVPPLLSINFLPEGKFYRALLKINEKIIYNSITQIIASFNIKDYIFINSFNFHYPNVNRLLKPKLTVYHCVDPLILEHDTRHGLISEKLIVNASDLIICTSRQLYEEKIALNKNTYFIPNAADFRLSSKALGEELQVHLSLSEIKRPIIGYFGNIERRIDYVLMEQVIKMNENLSFVFAGPVNNDFIPKAFLQLKNLHLIGQIPHELMPSVLKGFDVAMLPFKKDDVSKTIFPLKLFEYLGSGKPVVATDFNLDLKEFTFNTVNFSRNAFEFSQDIKNVMSGDDAVKKEQRIGLAKSNSWESRLYEISELINKHLKNF